MWITVGSREEVPEEKACDKRHVVVVVVVVVVVQLGITSCD